MKTMRKNALKAGRTFINNRNRKEKRSINTLVPYKVTKLGLSIQSNGLNRIQLELGWQNEALVKNDQMSRLLETQRRSAEMKLTTNVNGRETTELPVNNSSHDLDKFERDIYQLNTADNWSIDQVKALYDNFTSDYLTHLNNLWGDCMSKLTEIQELAVDLGGTAADLAVDFGGTPTALTVGLGVTVTIRLIAPFSNQIVKVTREYILNHLSTSGNPDVITIDDLYVITIDRFEIFITKITWEPFFNELLPKIYNLIKDINSYELSGYALNNTSNWLQNKLYISEDINNWINVKNKLITESFYSDYNLLLETVQFLGEGNILI